MPYSIIYYLLLILLMLQKCVSGHGFCLCLLLVQILSPKTQILAFHYMVGRCAGLARRALVRLLMLRRPVVLYLSQGCSVGFRSGLSAGYSSSLMPSLENHVYLTLDVPYMYSSIVSLDTFYKDIRYDCKPPV